MVLFLLLANVQGAICAKFNQLVTRVVFCKGHMATAFWKHENDWCIKANMQVQLERGADAFFFQQGIQQ